MPEQTRTSDSELPEGRHIIELKIEMGNFELMSLGVLAVGLVLYSFLK